MSIVVTETLNNRNVTFSRGSYKSATREFLVYDDAGASIDVSEVLAQADIPSVSGWAAQGEFHPTLPLLTAQDATIEAHDEHKNVFVVKITYKQLLVWGPDSNFPGYMEFSGGVAADFRDTWRRLPIRPDDIDNPDDEDIEGTAIDVKGEPISVPFTTSTFEIQHVIEGDAPFTHIHSLAGKRNESHWGAFEAGTVLYEGARATTVGIGRRRLTHTFHHDPMYHLRQVSVPHMAGGTAIGDGTVSGYELKAYPVIWRQPFPDVVDFASLGVDEALYVE